MFSSSRCGNFTWNGTLKGLKTSYGCGGSGAAERYRPSMAAPSSSGLEVLLSTLQQRHQEAGDIESTLNILNVLDELLSAGTDRRIHYMISKGGSESLLMALLNTVHTLPTNYTLLLPILHLLAKVGHRDRRIGVKAEKAEAVLVMLSLLRQNLKDPRRTTACLYVIQVFCASVSTATLLGKNRALDIVFRLIPTHTTKHIRTVKAAIDALAALLRSKVNCRAAVSKGYISGLLKLFADWHNNDTEREYVHIQRALLHCLDRATRISLGRSALVADGGIELLYQTTQTCMFTRGSLECLVEPAVQLMRKCYPKCPLSLSSDQSVYTFPLPGEPPNPWDVPTSQGDTFEDDSDDDNDDENEDADNKDYEDDLETDLESLRQRPQPDRPLEQLGQYVRLCPELHHDFQELDSCSESEESSDEDSLLNGDSDDRWTRSRTSKSGSRRRSSRISRGSPHFTGCKGHTSSSLSNGHSTPEEDGEQQDMKAKDLHSHCLRSHEEGHSSMVDRLVERFGACIPHHDPRLYAAAAAHTRSIAGYSILAFPDFWGHLPVKSTERMAIRRPNLQRKMVLEDIQRFLCPEDIINKVVFDMEDPSPQSASDHKDSLRFFSNFECGNLRKAVQVRRFEYDLILNADANTSMHHQWFYFEVSGMMANVPYRFNIINCEKTNSQFNYGMQPVLYSVREALEGRPRWLRSGSEICYYRNHFQPGRGERSSCFYTLTFTVTFKHDEDVCYLAYHYPYTYSGLQAHLQMLQRSVDPRKVFFRQQSLCNTLAGNPCPLITITACPTSRKWKNLHQLRNRPCVVLTARVHPGESNASWVMKGSLEFLCSSDPVAQSLREAFIFKIIPMLNPDGVINGTHRCSLTGEDLNRQWKKPDPALSPTIYHTKGFLYYLNSIGRTPLVFCDYHGHSRKKNVFLYGCSVKETLWQSGSSVDTATLKEDPGYRTIPKTLDRIAPAFSFNSCNYLVEKSRASTARVVVWREIGVLRAYTMESTYNGCDQGIYQGMQMGTWELEEMGSKFCQSLLTLRKSAMLYDSKVISHTSLLDDSPLDHKSHTCFVDDEPPCVEEIEYHSPKTSDPPGHDLDAEVSANMYSTDDEDKDKDKEKDKGKDGDKQQSPHCRRTSHSSDLQKSHHHFPPLCRPESLETL
ncbi:cytosolic carboxypeptidase 4 isoform X2 [Engraulis encrasicolus]|uniref:cytosolic carboxypeptidase 4 isoform X2 n=1 Tax=Engraulis encrasicolus TaxID=184585 RepID=UPI002FCEB28A